MYGLIELGGLVAGESVVVTGPGPIGLLGVAVAKAMGYDLGEDYLKQALGYLEKVGVHKDSMCYDIENKTPTEIDFLGAKIVDYARAKGISVPIYTTMTNLIKAMEDSYLGK